MRSAQPSEITGFKAYIIQTVVKIFPFPKLGSLVVFTKSSEKLAKSSGSRCLNILGNLSEHSTFTYIKRKWFNKLPFPINNLHEKITHFWLAEKGVQFVCNTSAKQNFSKTNKSALAPRACALLLVFEKFTRAYLFQISLEIMWLPMLSLVYSDDNNWWLLGLNLSCCPHRVNLQQW